MLVYQMPDVSIIKEHLKEGCTYSINKEAGKFITVWGHKTFKHFDEFEVIKIGKYSVDLIFRNVLTGHTQSALMTDIFLAKYLENLSKCNLHSQERSIMPNYGFQEEPYDCR